MGIQTTLAAGIVLLISVTNLAEACSCIPGSRPSIPETYVRAKNVFKGTVTMVTPDPSVDQSVPFTYNLNVHEVWKGNPKNLAFVQSRNSALCGFTFSLGLTYIVYEEEDGYVHGYCNGRTASPTAEHEAILDDLARSMPDCVQTTPRFNAGYGPCSTYAEGNFDYCDSHFVFDDVNQVFAEDACSECGKCVDGPPAPLCIESNMDFDVGYGDCSTYSEGQPNHEYCTVDGAHLACATCGYVFLSEYGDCSTYAEGEPNHENCSRDSDERTGIMAMDACRECKMCNFGPETGSCPKPPGVGPCVELCNPVTNEGCDANNREKCCSNGCGHTCQVV